MLRVSIDIIPFGNEEHRETLAVMTETGKFEVVEINYGSDVYTLKKRD